MRNCLLLLAYRDCVAKELGAGMLPGSTAAVGYGGLRVDMNITIDGFIFSALTNMGAGPSGIIVDPQTAQFDNPAWLHALKTACTLWADLDAADRLEDASSSFRLDTEMELTAHLDDPGFVYILRSTTGHYKIGRTKDPENRLRIFDVKLPFRVDFTLLISSDRHRKLEQELHRRFADKRLDGEWFALTPEDIEALHQEFGNE